MGFELVPIDVACHVLVVVLGCGSWVVPQSIATYSGCFLSLMYGCIFFEFAFVCFSEVSKIVDGDSHHFTSFVGFHLNVTLHSWPLEVLTCASTTKQLITCLSVHDALCK